jgi:cytochrome oxidase assembly protein ShyY1
VTGRNILRVLLLLFAIVTAMACVWQISRGFERGAQYEQWLARSEMPALAQAGAVRVPEHDNRQLQISADFDENWLGFLDNRSHQSHPGYWVLQLAETDVGTVLVARGWAPASGDRRQLPRVERLSGTHTLQGTIHDLTSDSVDFFGLNSESLGDGIHRFQQLSPDAIEPTTDGQLLLPWYLQLTDADDELVRDWPVPGPRGKHTSFGYSIQWALMSLAALFFLWRVARKPHDD